MRLFTGDAPFRRAEGIRSSASTLVPSGRLHWSGKHRRRRSGTPCAPSSRAGRGVTELSTTWGSFRQWGKYSGARAPVTATQAVSALAAWNAHQRRARLEEGSEEGDNLPRVRRRQSTFQQASDMRAKSLLPWCWRRLARNIPHDRNYTGMSRQFGGPGNISLLAVSSR